MPLSQHASPHTASDTTPHTPQSPSLSTQPHRPGLASDAPASQAPVFSRTISHCHTHPLDPRPLLLYAVTANLIFTTFPSHPLLLATLALTAVLMAIAVSRRVFLSWLAYLALCAFICLAMPMLWPSTAGSLITFVSIWMIRFGALFGAIISTVFLMDLPRVGAVATILHAPSWVYVPVMVIIRFLPQSLVELRAISEALSLRGMAPTSLNSLRHPLRTGEYILIPLLSCAARTADELSAAAIIKGLGSPTRRTSALATSLSRSDIILFSVTAILLAWECMELMR